LPLQSAKPALHTIPQTLAAQVGDALGRAGQAPPHVPQLAALVLRSTSHPSAELPLQSPRPGSHTTTQPVALHMAVAWLAPWQAAPHDLQWAMLVRRSVSQPSAALPLQSPKPGRQGRTQRPASQVAVVLAVGAQATPQPPQFAREVCGSMQAPPHVACGASQRSWHRPVAQNSPEAQARPHSPQLARSEATSTQAVPQAVRPAGHAQRPPVQT
jgi:hypothetical protein